MKRFNFIKKFAVQNLKANKILELPFIISSGVMFTLFNIMFTLTTNSYVKTRHKDLIMFVGYAVFIVAIFTFIFNLYANGMLIKKRNKEFALYSILGLEKKHIRKILSFEYFIMFSVITIIGVIGGYVFGKLIFILLNRLLNDTGASVIDYNFSYNSLIATILFSFIIYLTIIIRNSFSIYLSTPITLLNKQYKGEGEPKSRWIISLLGLISISAGIYIALTIKGILSSILYFFLAALLVIIGTYLLYISFSIIIMKYKKNRKKTYYTPNKFLSISGLIYRIKSNAVSLASIAILCAGVIITLSSTFAIYSAIEKNVSNVNSREYSLNSNTKINDENELNQSINYLENAVLSSVNDKSNVKNHFTSYGFMLPVLKDDNHFKSLPARKGNKDINFQNMNFLLTYDLNSYNKMYNKNISLNDDELLVTANQKQLLSFENIKIGDKEYKTKIIDNIIPSKYAVEVYAIIAKDFETVKYFHDNLLDSDNKENSGITSEIHWDVENEDKKVYEEKLKNEIDKNLTLDIRSENIKLAYELNGGFLFLGIIITLIFLTGTILITYYKQVNEAYQDQQKYQIMKKVGLEDNLIKKTAKSQIITLLFVPFIISVIYSFLASKIVSQLLGLFGIESYFEYTKYLLIVSLFFLLFYIIIFNITSRVYYKIVR